MLSSVSDLLTYIDEQQLTPELGGTLEYCHSEWVIFRTVSAGWPRALGRLALPGQGFWSGSEQGGLKGAPKATAPPGSAVQSSQGASGFDGFAGEPGD